MNDHTTSSDITSTPVSQRDADWRAFENGTPVVAVGATSLPEVYDYQEGLQEYRVSEAVWLKTVTVARQGEGNASQHIIAQRTTAGGVTWSVWFDIEPEGPPPSSYGGFFRHPLTGRVAFMYTLGPERDPTLADGRPFYGHRHHVGQIVYRYVSDQGEFSERYVLNLPLRAVDRANVFAGAHTLHYGHPLPQVLIGEDGYGWYTKLGPEPYVSNGEAFIVRYVGYANNDRIEELELELLPRGEHGLQPPDAECICGIAPIAIQDRTWLFKFRTTTGHAGLVKTLDGGQTWSVGDLCYAPGGRPVKNPESPFSIVTDHKGRLLLTFYNDSYSIGFGSFAARDLVYLSHLRLVDSDLYVSEPELFYYRRDQGGYERHSLKRLNPPHLIISADGVYGQGSDKLSLRRFAIPERFLDTLASQHTCREIPQEGLILATQAARDGHRRIPAPLLPRLSDGGAFTLTFMVKAEHARARSVILDGLAGCGLRVITWRHENLLIAMSDGTQTVRLESDAGSLAGGQRHCVSIIVDGRPGLITMTPSFERISKAGSVSGRAGRPSGSSGWSLSNHSGPGHIHPSETSTFDERVLRRAKPFLWW